MRKIIVNKKYDGKKLSNFISDSFPALNKNTLYKTFRKKDIRINNVKISKDCLIHSGDEVTLYIVDEILYGCNTYNIESIYEDDNILVVNKPENISVTEDSNNSLTLSDIIKRKYGNNVNPCHRIDRNTKGIVLFAKNQLSLEIILEKFKNKEIEKHYITKVYGIPKSNHSVLKAYLFKDSKKSLVYISDTLKKDYIEITTEYTLLSKNTSNNTSILDINLHTGRTHQIRAHLSHIGLPIIGDGKYGINDINKKFKERNQLLYSYSLKFNFQSDSGILNYLNGKIISLPNIPIK